MKLTCALLLGALNLLTATSCKKDETELEKLPAVTQTGRGKAGFLLDGRAWLPKASKLGSGTSVWATRYRTVVGHSLRVDCYRDDDQTNFFLFVPNIRQAATYQLNQLASFTMGDRNPAYGAYVMSKEVPDRVFLTGPTTIGTLTITRFDTVDRVVSGSFEMTVQEINSPETHQLTDGRFDVKF
jgi:hypothetical protein